MATLDLKVLKCIRKQDVTGKDEPLIKVDGAQVWNGVVRKGEDVDIDVQVDFTDTAKVIVNEMNGAKAKQIGVAAVVREAGNPDKLTFKTSGAWYEVEFEVTASPA